MASLWTWTAIAMSSSTGGEDWSGLGILIIASTTTLAILVSMAIGVTVALVRARRHGWPTPAPTGKAIFAGTRTAAWGLCAIVANLLLILYWIWWRVDIHCWHQRRRIDADNAIFAYVDAWYNREVRHEALPHLAGMKGPRSGAVAAARGSWGQSTPGDTGVDGSSPDDDGTRWYCQTVRVWQARPEGGREEPVPEAL
jgi:hypothetical protein